MIIYFKSFIVNLQTPADSTMLIYNLGQKVLNFCPFLVTECLYHRFGITLTPPLAPPGQSCSVGVRNNPAGSQHGFLGERESICSCLYFQEFYLET